MRPYLEPVAVTTTEPPIASFITGDVKIVSPFENDEDPEIMPDIVPSGFCVHSTSVGTPLGADEIADENFLNGSSSVSPNLNRPNDIVAPGLAN